MRVAPDDDRHAGRAHTGVNVVEIEAIDLAVDFDGHATAQRPVHSLDINSCGARLRISRPVG